MKHCITILILFLLAAGSVCHAQDEQDEYAGESLEEMLSRPDPGNLTTTKEYKKKNIDVRKFDDKKWKEVTGSTAYNEDQARRKARAEKENATPPGANGTKRRYPDRDEGGPESSYSGGGGPWMGFLLKFFFYGVIILIIGMILYAIIRNISIGSTPKNRKIETAGFTTTVEDINDLDVDTLLQKTQATGNYRLAVRIYFLGLLKKLNETGLIVWKKDKTNRDYLSELFSKQDYFREVSRLTLAYEQVWYGDHALPAELYNTLTEEFKAIDQKLTASKNP